METQYFVVMFRNNLDTFLSEVKHVCSSAETATALAEHLNQIAELTGSTAHYLAVCTY